VSFVCVAPEALEETIAETMLGEVVLAYDPDETSVSGNVDERLEAGASVRAVAIWQASCASSATAGADAKEEILCSIIAF
jgi:hypothetical protein